jgi:hypothetical protein
MVSSLLPSTSVQNIFKEKKSDFKTICFKKNQKILRRNSRRKLQKHGKKKNDNDEI